MRIWINQGFSLHGLVETIVKSRPALDLAISAISPDAPVRQVAPDFWTEPGNGAEDYPGWLLDTAVARGIDTILVQRGHRAVARRLDRFAAAGIRAAVPATADVLDLLDDKAAFAADLAGDDHLCPGIAITSAAAFEAAVAVITADGADACVKPTRGIYGAGYWTLSGDDPFSHLTDPDARRITPAMFAAGLRAAEDRGQRFSLLVMEHLPGLEVSIDIVARQSDMLLAAVRTKLDANRQRITTRHALIDHATALVRRYALHGAVNIQYKQDRHGGWRILEINTRPAGGASYCDSVGIPFATTWIDLALGRAAHFTDAIDAEVLTLVKPTPMRG